MRRTRVPTSFPVLCHAYEPASTHSRQSNRNSWMVFFRAWWTAGSGRLRCQRSEPCRTAEGHDGCAPTSRKPRWFAFSGRAGARAGKLDPSTSLNPRFGLGYEKAVGAALVAPSSRPATGARDPINALVSAREVAGLRVDRGSRTSRSRRISGDPASELWRFAPRRVAVGSRGTDHANLHPRGLGARVTGHVPIQCVNSCLGRSRETQPNRWIRRGFAAMSGVRGRVLGGMVSRDPRS